VYVQLPEECSIVLNDRLYLSSLIKLFSGRLLPIYSLAGFLRVSRYKKHRPDIVRAGHDIRL
jgi:hypothetical protein